MTSPAFSLKIPCKPYIKKFCTAYFGDPVKIDNSTTFGLIVNLSLQKNLYENRHYRDEAFEVFKRERPENINCIISAWQFTHLGHDIPKETVIVANRALESMFDECLSVYVQERIKPKAEQGKRYKGYHASLMSFIDFYDISEDISFDGLKRKELRYRNSLARRRSGENKTSRKII